MALNQNEQLLLEAIQSMLSGKAKLGLAVHDKKTSIDDESHTAQYLHENIEQQFHLDTADLIHHQSICAAFNKIHSYKYVTDPKFYEAFRNEMQAMAVPKEELEAAIKSWQKVLNEVKGGAKKNWVERDAGWHPDLEGIIAVSQPEQAQD